MMMIFLDLLDNSNRKRFSARKPQSVNCIKTRSFANVNYYNARISN